MVGSSGLPFALQLAAMNGAAAQTTSDYRALVCLFMAGGNDAHNVLLATDNDTWARYFAARNTGADPIALMPVGTAPTPVGAVNPVTGRTVTLADPGAWGGVLPIVPRTANPVPPGTNAMTRTFALHPFLAPLRPIYAANRLALMANVGTLVQPTTKAQYVARSVPLPKNLFSHNDQVSTWQAGEPEGAQFGWGGRMGDAIATMNGQNAVFTAVSTAGNAVFLAGQTVVQYQISTGTVPAIRINSTVGTTLFGSNLGTARMRSIIRDTAGPGLISSDHAGVVVRSMDFADTLNAAVGLPAATSIPAPTAFTNPITGLVEANTLATQLLAIAKAIASNSVLGMRRQVFFVNMGGFDTHDFQNRTQAALLAKVAHAMAYFDTVLGNVNGVNMRNVVTTFTASDFSRTFTTNGDGTDHAWGGHHLVMGGAVNGGDIYGQYPTLGVDVTGFSNPNMSGNALIPQVSVDQYSATLGRWFGISDSNMDILFPNLRNYSQRYLTFV